MKKGFILTMLIAIAGAAACAQGTSMGGGQWLRDAWLEYKRNGTGAISPSATTGELLNTAVEAGLFVGFVVGVTSAINDGTIRLLEIPDSISTTQVLAIVGRYLDAHPEELNQPAQILVLDALEPVFPPG